MTLVIVGLPDKPRFIRREVKIFPSLIGVHQVLKQSLQQLKCFGICGTHLESSVWEFPQFRVLVTLQDEIHVRGAVEVRNYLNMVMQTIIGQLLEFGG